MNEEILRLKKISKKFYISDKHINVLKDVNIKINKGELVSLTGPSGSGKSTLLHLIALMENPRPVKYFFLIKI